MKILIIGAHPDDEILGVGGTICRHVANGDEVHICIVTKAYEPQWSKKYMEQKVKEQKKVDDFLGITKRYNLDLPTVKLNTIPSGEFNKKISEVVDKINPNVIYTHYEHDLNFDHTLIFRAALVASRPPIKIKVLCFETLSETEWQPLAFPPNLWVDITKYLHKKIEAFLIYKSEVMEKPHPRSKEGIKLLAGKRGSEISVKYAEAFKQIRDYW